MQEKAGDIAGDMKMNPAYPVPEASKVLILAPHPDDEVLGCGGTMALYCAAGVPVHLAVVSDGGKLRPDLPDDPGIINARQEEVLAASKRLGVAEVHFMKFRDGELDAYRTDIRTRLESVLSAVRPEIVFAPSPADFHRDHITVSEIVISIMNDRGNFRVAFYEVYGTVRFNHLVDITEVMGVKEQALLEYKTSLFDTPELFVATARGINKFRSFFVREEGYYEAFWIASRPLAAEDIIAWLTYGMKAGQADAGLLEARAELESIRGASAWKLISGFYRFRDKVLPQGSGRRRLYDRMASALKH